VDKPALLRRLFELGCRYSGQVLSYTKMLGQLHDAGNTTTLAHYLELLAGAGLPKYSGRAARQRGSSPKLQVLNTALMSAQSGLSFEEARADRELWGRLVESAVGAHLAGAAAAGECELSYWRERNREVDFVVRSGRTRSRVGQPGRGIERGAEGRQEGLLPLLDGLSFLVSRPASELRVAVRWGDYAPAEIGGEGGKSVSVWQRSPRAETVAVALAGAAGPVVHDVPGSAGLQLFLVERRLSGDDLEGRIPEGTRSVSLFLVHHRTPDAENPDRAYAFQPEIEVESGLAFVPRPDLRGAWAAEWDEQVADLHYANTPEYATGHGTSAEWDVVDGACHGVRSAWIPSAEVERNGDRGGAGPRLHDGCARRARRRRGRGSGALAARRGVPRLDRREARGHRDARGHAARDRGGAAASCRRGRRPDRAGHRVSGPGRRCTRRLPGREPRRRAGARQAPRRREAPLAGVPARLPPPESSRRWC
jgi:hypothetical protein